MILVVPLLAYFVLLVRSRDLPASVSWWRRNAYAIVLGLATTVPLLPTLFLPTMFGKGLLYIVGDDGKLTPIPVSAWDYSIGWATVLLASWLVLTQSLQYMRSKDLIRGFDNLVLLDDGEVARRIGEMSADLGIRLPRVLQSQSESGLLVNAGAVDGVSPAVIVGDGVMNRMEPPERDAVLAHELGHLASHIGATRVVLAVLVSVASVFASGYLPMVVAAVWLLAAWVSALAACSHRAEFAADRLGASLVGNDVMAGALATIAGANYDDEHGPWLSGLLTHPHLAERTVRLQGERVPEAVAQDARVAARARVILRLVCAMFLGASFWLGSLGWTAVSLVLAAIVAGAPNAALLAALPWRRIREAREFGARLPSVVRCRIVFWSFTVVAVLLAVVISGDAGGVFALVGIAALLLALCWGRSELRTRRQLGRHVAAQEWHEWLQAYDAAPTRIRQRRDLWFLALEIAQQAGDPERAEIEYRGLTSRYPGYLFAHLIRAGQLRAGNTEEAVRLVRMVLTHVPGNASAMGALASALRAHGDFDAAWQEVQAALALRPDLTWLQAVACRIAIARGDLKAARQALAAAQQRDPKELLTLLAHADLAIAERSEQAAELVAACQARILVEPFRNYESDVERLVGLLDEQAPVEGGAKGLEGE